MFLLLFLLLLLLLLFSLFSHFSLSPPPCFLTSPVFLSGTNIERWYQRAALIFWPRKNRAECWNTVKLARTLEALKKLTSDAGKNEELRKHASSVASHLIKHFDARWNNREFRSAAEVFLEILREFEEPSLISSFLRFLFESEVSYYCEDGDFILDLIEIGEKYGWKNVLPDLRIVFNPSRHILQRLDLLSSLFVPPLRFDPLGTEKKLAEKELRQQTTLEEIQNTFLSCLQPAVKRGKREQKQNEKPISEDHYQACVQLTELLVTQLRTVDFSNKKEKSTVEYGYLSTFVHQDFSIIDEDEDLVSDRDSSYTIYNARTRHILFPAEIFNLLRVHCGNYLGKWKTTVSFSSSLAPYIVFHLP
jgi:hypothetical protein